VKEGLDVKGVIEFLSAMTEKTGYPVPAPSGFASRWSEGLDLPRDGSERLLFTGALYQLMPYLNAVVRLLEGLGGLPRAFRELMALETLLACASKASTAPRSSRSAPL